MDQSLIKNIKISLILGLPIALLFVFVSPYLLIAGLALLAAVYFLKQEFVLPLSIIVFLILTGQELEKYRSIVTILLIILLGVMFLKKFGLAFNSYPKIPSQIIYYISFLFITLFISSAFSIDPFSSYLSVARLLVFLLVCYFYFALIQNGSTIDNYLLAIFISVLIVGISILIDILKTGFVLFLLEGTIVRYGGIYENPNYVGLLLLITIPINITLFFRQYKYPANTKFCLALLLVISIILLFVSNSRSSIIGVIIASGMAIALINKKIFIRFLITLTLSITILLLLNEIQDYVSLYFRLERVGNREYFWNAGVDIIFDHPFLGVGPELFDKYFFTYMPSAVTSLYESSTWVVGRPHPHNFFLLFMAENGILGLISAVSFFVLFFLICIKTLSKVKRNKSNEFLLVVSVLSIGVGIFIRAFFEVTGIITYGFITRDLPFWLLFIIVVHIYQKDDDQMKLKNDSSIQSFLKKIA